MKKTLFFLPMLCILAGAAAFCSAKGAVLRLSDGATISFEQMIAQAQKADVILVGELHDSAEHHQMQLAVIKALHASGIRLAVGLEMFRADSQAQLDQWIAGASTLEQFLPVYYDNWRVAWPLYRDILTYAREQKIPLIGLNVPQAVTRKVARRGFSSLTPEDKKGLPPNISCNVDPQYQEFIKRAYSGHDTAEKAFLHFCEAQMVWDTSMAWHLIQYLRKHQGAKAVVLTGAGHAWKRGIPTQIAQQSKLSTVVILPHIPGEVDKKRITAADADYLILQ